MTSATIGKCAKAVAKTLGTDSTMVLASGHKMPFFGIGTSLLNDKEVLEKTLTTAVGVGYRQIDTAFSYGNQKIIGEVLQKVLDGGIVKREDLFIVDKLPSNGMRDVEHFLKKSMADLQLDYIDLYLIHSPIATNRTENDNEVYPFKDGALVTEHVDLVETWKAMEEMVNKGYVKSIGLSNFNSEQIQRIYDAAVIKPANLQVECHVYLPQNELHAFCDKLDISVTAYCPIGNPNFPKFARDVMGLDYPEAPVLTEDEKLKEIGQKHKKTAAQVALRYLVQRGISVIPKSTNPERIERNMELFDFSLDDKDMEVVAGLSLDKGFRYITMDFWKGMKEHPEYPFSIPF